MVKDLLLGIKEKITYGTDPGISIEIKAFFNECEGIEAYNISVTENKDYKLSVKLKKLSLFESKKVFSAFLRFIEYPAGSFYSRKNTDKLISYSLLSFNEDLEGFYCELHFE